MKNQLFIKWGMIKYKVVNKEGKVLETFRQMLSAQNWVRENGYLEELEVRKIGL